MAQEVFLPGDFYQQGWHVRAVLLQLLLQKDILTLALVRSAAAFELN
jgi:hypothetical protein